MAKVRALIIVVGQRNPLVPLLEVARLHFTLANFLLGGTSASKKQAAKGGNTLRPLPALQRVPVAEPDSSDEEDAALLALGEQGR